MGTADMSMMFSLTPQESRSSYTACVMLGGQAGLFLAGLLATRVAASLEPYSVHVAGRTFGNLHFLAALAIVFLLTHLFVIIPRLPTSVQVQEAESVKKAALVS